MSSRRRRLGDGAPRALASMAVTLTRATPGILILATLGGTSVLASTISLAAALATVVGPVPGAVPASAASVAAPIT